MSGDILKGTVISLGFYGLYYSWKLYRSRGISGNETDEIIGKEELLYIKMLVDHDIITSLHKEIHIVMKTEFGYTLKGEMPSFSVRASEFNQYPSLHDFFSHLMRIQEIYTSIHKNNQAFISLWLKTFTSPSEVESDLPNTWMISKLRATLKHKIQIFFNSNKEKIQSWKRDKKQLLLLQILKDKKCIDVDVDNDSDFFKNTWWGKILQSQEVASSSLSLFTP
jgi:hypothetical protein